MQDGLRHRLSLGNLGRTKDVEACIQKWELERAASHLPDSAVFALAVLQCTHIHSNASAWRGLSEEETAQACATALIQR